MHTPFFLRLCMYLNIPVCILTISYMYDVPYFANHAPYNIVNILQSSNEMVGDEAVNLTSEKHDPCAQKSPTQKKKTRIPCRRYRCRASQIPSEG